MDDSAANAGVIRDAHGRTRESLRQLLSAVEAKARIAREELERAERHQRVIHEKLMALEQADRLYEMVFADLDTLAASVPGAAYEAVQTPAEPPPPPAAKQVRARMGPQRYRMFKVIKNGWEMAQPVTIAIIASSLGLDPRRVKEQMSSDQHLGFVRLDGDVVHVTVDGAHLFNRYEASRTARGLPLPSLEDTSDNEQDEEDFPSGEASNGYAQGEYPTGKTSGYDQSPDEPGDQYDMSR